MTNTSSLRRNGRVPIVGAMALAALLMLILPAGLAGASAAPTTSPSQTLWAYGAVETTNFDGASHWWTYSGSATYGYSVILNQTNLSATTVELNANRTMGAEFQIHYCHPNCNSPVYYGNETDRLYETIAASAVLSTNGAVTENDASVPAIALNSSDATIHANLTETGSSFRPVDGILGVRSHYLAANVVATSSVTFSPGLGILPNLLSSPQTWNSSSEFAAHVAADYDYFGAASGPLASGRIGPVTGNISVPANGTVALTGSYAPSNTVVLGGVSYPEVSLRVDGPFTVREGFILVPSAIDLFGGTAQPWGNQENGTATATMNYLDARAVEGHHLGIGASEWVYDSSTVDPNSTTSALPGGSGLASSDSGVTDGASGATTVQGMPETVASAQSQQTCLVVGSGCPAGSTSSGGLRGLVGLLAVGVVVILVVSVVVLVSERRRMPPPAYPNAALYPPGAPRPGPTGTPGTPPPPAEDDPLQNLW